MSFDFNNDSPIYLQIIDHLKNLIISKKYLPNDRLPSVRELSLMFEVNPNTIQKALNELEDEGLIYTERTNGKFVTSNENIINHVKEQTINNVVDNFCNVIKELGIDKKEIINILKNKE